MIRSIAFFGIMAAVFTFNADHVAAQDFYAITGSIEVLKKGGKKPLNSFDNVVVYLRGPEIAVENPPPVIVKQKNKQFHPRILPIIKGQTVHFYNYDDLDHNVFSPSKSESFDLGHYPIHNYKEHQFNKPGLHKVYCNIHKSMILDIIVLANPYFTTTDSQGKFSINNVPKGQYTLHAWHIFGGSRSINIKLTQNTNLAKQTLVSTRVVRQLENHLNKQGKPYQQKKYFN